MAERLAEVGLAPAHLGVLRIVGRSPGTSQQAVAVGLGVAPSRVVALVDELEAEGLVERRRSTTDRRLQELHVPAAAGPRMARVRAIVRDHDADLTAGLSEDERAQLTVLLGRVAEQQGLEPEAHP
jgi:DNA-binding MarR family transcriptional regulator